MLAQKLIMACGCIIGLVAIGNAFFDQLGCEGQLFNNNVVPSAAQQIFGQRVIGQSFIAPRHGLNRLDLFFETYQRHNDRDVTLKLWEVSPLDRTLQFSQTFNAASIEDQTWRKFTFPPMANSAGKTYLITLQSPQSRDGNAITIGGIEQNVYPNGTAFAGETIVLADAAFRSCYDMTWLDKWQTLATQFTRHRPSVWGQTSFYVVCFIIYGGLSLTLFWKL